MKRKRKLIIWIALIVGLCGVLPAALLMIR